MIRNQAFSGVYKSARFGLKKCPARFRSSHRWNRFVAISIRLDCLFLCPLKIFTLKHHSVCFTIYLNTLAHVTTYRTTNQHFRNRQSMGAKNSLATDARMASSYGIRRDKQFNHDLQVALHSETPQLRPDNDRSMFICSAVT